MASSAMVRMVGWEDVVHDLSSNSPGQRFRLRLSREFAMNPFSAGKACSTLPIGSAVSSASPPCTGCPVHGLRPACSARLISSPRPARPPGSPGMDWRALCRLAGGEGDVCGVSRKPCWPLPGSRRRRRTLSCVRDTVHPGGCVPARFRAWAVSSPAFALGLALELLILKWAGMTVISSLLSTGPGVSHRDTLVCTAQVPGLGWGGSPSWVTGSHDPVGGFPLVSCFGV